MVNKNSTIKPSWDDYFMAIARLIATRSTCDRLHAGAVLVKDKRIVSTGYNGSPPGLPHCDDVGHLLEQGHCVRTIHAEHNALLQAAVIGGASTKDTTLYALYSPCIHCAKYIVAAGVKRVVVGKIYRNEEVKKYLEQAGVVFATYKNNSTWNNYLEEIFTEEIEEKKAPKIKFIVKK